MLPCFIAFVLWLLLLLQFHCSNFCAWLLLCFTASVVLCFVASVLHCFCFIASVITSALHCIIASVLWLLAALCFIASLYALLLHCFIAFVLHCFCASLLLCFDCFTASLHCYLYITAPLLHCLIDSLLHCFLCFPCCLVLNFQHVILNNRIHSLYDEFLLQSTIRAGNMMASKV